MRLNWKPSTRATALNFARQSILLHDSIMGQGVNSEMLVKYRLAAQVLHLVAHEMQPIHPWNAWGELIGICSSGQDVESHAKAWLSSITTQPVEQKLEPVAGAIRQLEAILAEDQPQLAVQLQYRLNPLQQQWDGYGNAIFAHLRRLTQVPKKDASVDVLLVSPVVDGDGFACVGQKSIMIEALFVNPVAGLPEVLRLAWLAAQVAFAATDNCDLDARRLQDVNALALLPCILAVGEIVELTRCDEAAVQLALREFAPRQPIGDGLEKKLLHWWETYLQTKPNWEIALAALDRSLQK